MHIHATSTILAAERSSLIQANEAAEASRRARELRNHSVRLLAETGDGNPHHSDEQLDPESAAMAEGWSKTKVAAHASGNDASPHQRDPRFDEPQSADPSHRPVSFWA